MPKKPTGFTPKGKNDTKPMPTKIAKNPLAQVDGGSNNVASMPGIRVPKLTRPAPLKPRTPGI